MGAKSAKYKFNGDAMDEVIRQSNESLTMDEIELHREQFNQNYPDGRISKKAFYKIFKQQFEKDKVPVKLTKHIFRVYDGNDDGFIDFGELMVVLSVMSNGTPEENLQKIFRIFDINSDKTVSIKEMKKIVGILGKLALDENKNDVDLKAKDAHEAVFEEMDCDKNGKVSVEEFTEAILANKKFSQVLALKVVNIFVKTDI